MDLIDHIKEQKKRLQEKYGSGCCPLLLEGCDAVLAKLQKYNKLAREHAVYLAATICDPRKRYGLIRDIFKDSPEDLADATKRLRDFFDAFFVHKSQDDQSSDTEGPTTEEPTTERPTIRKTWKNRNTPTSSRSGKTSADEEFNRLLDLDSIEWDDDFDPIAYWRENGSSLPTWKFIAFSTLTIPASSAEAERVFSRSTPRDCGKLIASAKETCTARANALKAETIEAKECMRHWIVTGLMDAELNLI
jgi:hypothetical protein